MFNGEKDLFRRAQKLFCKEVEEKIKKEKVNQGDVTNDDLKKIWDFSQRGDTMFIDLKYVYDTKAWDLNNRTVHNVGNGFVEQEQN